MPLLIDLEFSRLFAALSVTLAACGASSSTADSGPLDATTGVDASPLDASPGKDVVEGDAKVDDGATDGIAPDGNDTDSGDAAACGPSSCGARTCGPSPCGFVCGVCSGTKVCTNAGSCADQCQGTSCTDAWGASVCYGAQGFRTCTTDAKKTQLCTCAAGTWSNCNSCETGSCLACADAKCATSYDACQNVPTCKAYFACAVACKDATCQAKCFADFTSDTSDVMRSCMSASCANECKK